MHGDYSRGHEPDRKRGRAYRRVLLQMARPVLDSDVAGLVDAVLGEVRTTARELGCAAGSSDLGFLVTPGRLVAMFAEAADALQVVNGAPDAWLDYRFRLADRYPALQIATPAGPATVRIPALQGIDPAGLKSGALWARVEDPVVIVVNGVSVALAPHSPDDPQRVEFAAAASSLAPVEILVPANAQVWLFALEQDEQAGSEPALWVAPGSYMLDGLIVDAHGGGRFPAVSFPTAAGFGWDESPGSGPPLDGLVAPTGLGAGTRLVAYLEAWERHITAIEDPGLLEPALGGTDTTARTELLGQVKLATVSGLPVDTATAAAEVRRRFAALAPSGGELTIEVPQATPTADPCALPDVAGYSGDDNRLYRIEVHQGGPRAAARFKWSRDNGSELFTARLSSAADRLVFDTGTPLADGDVVELLSHVVDLGDSALGGVDATVFVPPERAVGQLARLVAVPSGSGADEIEFRLVRTNDGSQPVIPDDRYGTLPEAVLKVRRWHGLLEGGPGALDLEDGITATLSATGQFRAGQYWQYEARVREDGTGGDWRPAPHGPERRFAPLALLQYESASEPLRLLDWLDERCSHPCDLDADGVAFAGARVGSSSDTVQEAIEELFERPPEIVDASCGELIVRAENTIQSVFDTIPAGESARLCLQPGTWVLDETVDVAGKGDLIISGAGGATLLRGVGIDTVLRFTGCGRVRIHDLTIEGGDAALAGDRLAGSLALVDCAGVDLERVTVSCGDAPSRRMSAVGVRSSAVDGSGPTVRVHDCDLRAGHAQVALLVVNATSADIEGNLVRCLPHAFPLEGALADPVVFGRVARLALTDIAIGPFDDNMLVGGNTLSLTLLDGGGNRVSAVIGEWAAAFDFTTRLALSVDNWVQLFEQNPIPPGNAEATPADFVEKRLRDLRRQLANIVLGRPDTLAGVAAATRNALKPLGIQLRARNDFAAGGQGIVVAGRGTPMDEALAQVKVLTDEPRPDVRVCGNRVLGFVQGIHVATRGTSDKPDRRGLTYSATISDNTVHLRVPSLAGERHGIFVGGAFRARVTGNMVELRRPAPHDWPNAPQMDAIRAFGTYGPLLQIVDNTCIGTTRGVVAHAINAGNGLPFGWRWTVAANAHARAGAAVPETINWFAP